MKAVVIAEFVGGAAAYLSRARATEKRYTTLRRLAWAMTPAEADEMASRLNAVKDGGVYHADVAYFRVGIRR